MKLSVLQEQRQIMVTCLVTSVPCDSSEKGSGVTVADLENSWMEWGRITAGAGSRTNTETPGC